jgi:hypothetical protein
MENKTEELTEEQVKKEDFLRVCSSPKEVWGWIYTYLDIDLPFEHSQDDSTSSPIEAIYEIYSAIRDNKGLDNPGYILLSSRSGYKTLSSSILEVMVIFHFRLTIAHMAAVQSQSEVAIGYVNDFVRKLQPYWEHHKWEKVSDNKKLIQFLTPEKDNPFIKIIIASLQGANSSHTNLLFVDEVDVIQNPKAYEEAKHIPSYDRGRFPITVILSTRKFANGLMEKEISTAHLKNNSILRWNLVDITERCSPARHRPDLPKETRYVNKNMPLKQISFSDWENLEEQDKDRYLRIEAYAGCAKCKLLPVCRLKLAHKSNKATGGLYKPIDYTIGEFTKTTTNPDMAESQLLCWKPSSTGLVYPRFEASENGNLLNINKAYESLMGEAKKVTFDELIEAMLNLGIRFYAGLDWGHTKEFTMVVCAIMPNGEYWIVDNYASAGLEASDQIDRGKMFQEAYHVHKWFPDQAYPGAIVTWGKQVGSCEKFTKDVRLGIDNTRTVILNAAGQRKLKVLDIPRNERIKKTFSNHGFKLDSKGDPTEEPDDKEYSDTADAIRYLFQNLLGKANKKPTISFGQVPKNPELTTNPLEKLPISQKTGQIQSISWGEDPKPPKKGKFNWSV